MNDNHPYLAPDFTVPGSLHRVDLERDACGVGFVASIHGKKSHEILRYGLESVCNVTHRGALDADRKTGDGAGV
jgi:glutamate synthase domain-containing protein 1